MIPFKKNVNGSLAKESINTLQINLGRKCNLTCVHCHVDAGPKRKEELSDGVLEQLLSIIERFPQIETVDLTGGAPEMCHGFRELVTKAHSLNKQIIVRSNLTIFFVPDYEDLPGFFSDHNVRVVASLPCYLEENVDAQRGTGVFRQSIDGIRLLNEYGYGEDLTLDLVYNPNIPDSFENFRLTPNQAQLEKKYREFLGEQFGIHFNRLLTITNLPIGRTKRYLKRKGLLEQYIEFLSEHHNPDTLPQLMCRTELSVDYQGNVFDCDFNQMENMFSLDTQNNSLTVGMLLEAGSLNMIEKIRLGNHCYGCTAGAGASCGGALCEPQGDHLVSLAV